MLGRLLKADAIHIVSAWASEHGITLGQTVVDSKSNEITAIPELLDFIDVSNSIVTIDALGHRRKSPKKIIDANGVYVFAVKDNHPRLAQAIRDHSSTQKRDKRPRARESESDPSSYRPMAWGELCGSMPAISYNATCSACSK